MMNAHLTNAERKKIYRRDGFRCALCGNDRYLQIHHIVPRSQGGPGNNPANLITLCSDCHALAHGMNLRDWVDVTPADVKLAVVMYMADYYAENWGICWTPWLNSNGRKGP